MRRATGPLALAATAAAWLILRREWPPWAIMGLLVLGLLASAKLLLWSRCRVPAPRWRHAAFLLAWPGADPARFLDASSRAPPPPAAAWIRAAALTAAGAVLVWGAARVVPGGPQLRGWTGMVGLVLLLHFGALDLLALAWRRAGIDARPIMARPLRATSPGDLWSRRWNRPFRDVARALVLRPLAPRIGAGPALLAVFLFSGLAHEAVVSVPAGAGFGGPTVYFLIQGLAVLLQRRWPALRGGAIARATTAALAIVPLPILFHRPFVITVAVPLLGAIGA